MTKSKIVTLADLFEITSSKRVFEKDWTDSGVPFLRTREIVKLTNKEHLDNELFISEEMYDEYTAKYGKPNEGDLLVTAVGTLGACYIVKNTDRFYFKDGNIIWFKRKQDICSEYVQYAFQSEFLKNQINKTANAAVVGTYTITNAKKTKIPLPSLPEQKRIAALLDAADSLRQKDKALLAKYDELSKSLFLEMFGDPVRNEKGWEVKKFGQITINKDARRVPIKSSDRDLQESIYPYYGASGIIDFVDSFIFEEENLLIGEDGANLIARSTPIAFRANGKYWVNNHAHVIGVTPRANLIFLEYYINALDLSPYISGSAQPKLNRGNMDNIQISTPPIELQNKFANLIESIESQKRQVEMSLAKSEEVFRGVMGEVFG